MANKENNTTNIPKRSDKYKNNSTNGTKKVVSHSYKNNKTVKKVKDEVVKMDQNTLILFGIIFFVLIVVFLKTMGILMTILTVVGIGLIIFLSQLLKKLRKKKVVRVITNVFTIIFLLCCIIGLCGVAYFCYIIVTEAPTWDTDELNKSETTILYTEDGEAYAELSTEKRELVDYEDNSENLINAIIATEDSRFYQHNGFDALRFFKASVQQVVFKNSSAGGASTLSMQVVKNAFTDEDADKLNAEGIKRKFTDIYLAVFKLEKEYSKEEIFEFYVNNHFLGAQSFGVEQAAQTYFDKSASELTLAEASMIAGMFQAPTSYNPFSHPDAAEERRSEVLTLMYKHGYITKEQKELAESIPVESLLTDNTDSGEQLYQSYVDTVVEELNDKWGLDPYSTSLKVYTNIDTEKQQGLDDIFSGETYDWLDDNIQSGIAAVDVWTGKLVAVAGSRDSGAMNLNRATDPDLNKQIGSTAKPIFDYGPAMEYNNYSTYTLIDDSKYYYSSGQEIRDSDRAYLGVITLRTALAQSRNIPALKAFQSVDNSQIYEFVTSLGITPETSEGSTYVFEAHAIGAFNGASPLEMAAAYAAFANGGTYYEPYTINKIVYRDTGETVEYEAEGVQVMSDSTAFMITYCLQYAVTNGLSSGAAISGINIAAKTGTTNFTSETANYYNLPSYAVNDAWIVGYDPDTAVGMWLGYDKITDGYLKSASSGYSRNAQSERNKLYTTAGKILFTSNGKEFEVPDSVVKVAVEMGSDVNAEPKLASSSTPSSKITYEYFKKGTEPTEISSTYNKLSNVTGLSVSYDEDTGDVTLSWNAASQGSDYQDSYGDFGYKIYKDNSYIAFTTSTSYVISGQSNPAGTYKIVTSYENYSDTDSSGTTKKLTITTTTTEEDTGVYTADIINCPTTYGLGDDVNSCLTNGSISASCVKLYRDGEVISSGYTVTVTVVDSDGDTIAIDTSEAASYTATFKITYNGEVKVNKSVSITVTN